MVKIKKSNTRRPEKTVLLFLPRLASFVVIIVVVVFISHKASRRTPGYPAKPRQSYRIEDFDKNRPSKFNLSKINISKIALGRIAPSTEFKKNNAFCLSASETLPYFPCCELKPHRSAPTLTSIPASFYRYFVY